MKCRVRIDFEIDTEKYQSRTLETPEQIEFLAGDMLMGGVNFPEDWTITLAPDLRYAVCLHWKVGEGTCDSFPTLAAARKFLEKIDTSNPFLSGEIMPISEH